MRALRGSILALVPLALSASAMHARADEAADTATARALGTEGIVLADAGKCKEAIERLERAEKLHHAPTTAAWLGECEIAVGKLVVGTERLQRVVHEPLPPGASAAFGSAVQRARKALDAALPRIAKVRITVVAPPGTHVGLDIDGEALPNAALDIERHVDPGEHTATASAPGFLPARASIALGEGASKSITLELHPDPDAPPPSSSAPSAGVESTSSGTKAPAFVAFAVGAFGLGVGVAAGVVAGSKHSLLETSCDPNHVCPADKQAEIDAGKRWATISTAGFVGAGAGLVTGVVLLLAFGDKTKEERTSRAVRPVVSPTYAGVSGTF